MSRVVTIVTSALLTLAVCYGVASVLRWPEATEVGARGYLVRRRFEGDFRRLREPQPLVAWMGDSTIYEGGAETPYTEVLDRHLLSSGLRIETYNRSMPGLDQFTHYSVLGRVLDLHPSALFIIANLRLMTPHGAGRPVLQLTSMIPADELPRAVQLPWHARSITVPRLLLARALDWDRLEKRLHFVEGLREMFRDMLHKSEPELGFLDRMKLFAAVIRNYGSPLSRRSPAVQMLAASVDMAVRRGVPTTVVVAPIPVQFLKGKGAYGPQTRRGIAALREVVEAAGGEVLDLHDALPQKEFRDKSGHYTKQGTQHMVSLLAPVVRRHVESPDSM